MEACYQPPNILHLAGVTLADYQPVEDQFDERIKEQGNVELSSKEVEHPYDSIPTLFISLEEWPESSNLHCWNCHYTFDDRPKFVPLHVRRANDGSVECDVEGNFCTFNCAARFVVDKYHRYPDRQQLLENMCMMYYIFTGVRTQAIPPAPHGTCLQHYGGEIDADTFWEILRDLDPAHGLHDHRQGSVVPERLRMLKEGGEI